MPAYDDGALSADEPAVLIPRLLRRGHGQDAHATFRAADTANVRNEKNPRLLRHGFLEKFDLTDRIVSNHASSPTA